MMWTNTFHIKNSYLAYILPNLLVNGFYVIMARNYFASNIPVALLESAKMDGAGEFRILRSIVLPMSKPILATLGLFVSLNYWNDWQNGLYYISNDKMYTIQVLLNRMLLDTLYMQQGLAKNISSSIGASLPTATLKNGNRGSGSDSGVDYFSVHFQISLRRYCGGSGKRIT